MSYKNKTPKEVLDFQVSRRMPIMYMWRAIWKYFYDEKSCGTNHLKEIEKEILGWHEIVDEQKRISFERFGQKLSDKGDGTDGNFIAEVEFQLSIMCRILVYKETGNWGEDDSYRPFSEETVRIHELDYRALPLCIQFFPEVRTREGLERGQSALEANKKDQPHLYDGSEK